MVAAACRWKPSLSMISWTRAAVAGLTPGSPLTTRETVLIETSARRATSAIVGRSGPSSDDRYAPRGDNVGTEHHYPGRTPTVNGRRANRCSQQPNHGDGAARRQVRTA